MTNSRSLFPEIIIRLIDNKQTGKFIFEHFSKGQKTVEMSESDDCITVGSENNSFNQSCFLNTGFAASPIKYLSTPSSNAFL